MKKKIVALFLILIISVAQVLPIYASLDENINNALEKLDSIPSSQRQTYIILLAPMFMVDSGIDSIINSVKNYDESKKNESFLNAYIEKLLNYTEKDKIIKILESIKCTELTSRQELIKTIRYKNEFVLSNDTKPGLDLFLNSVYNRYPLMNKMLAEDGYNEAVLANILYNSVKINGDNAFYVYNKGLNSFSGGIISSDLKNSLYNIWKEEEKDNFNLDEILSMSAEKLNNNILPESREKVAVALAEIGFIKISSDGASGVGVSKEYDVNLANGETKTLTFETNFKRPTLYKKDGNLLKVVKYAVSENGKITAKLSESGKYIIKETPDKFTDCNGWAKEYIEMLAARNIINGKAENLYMPGDYIKREEFVKLIVELLDIAPNKNKYVFDDVDLDAWYSGYVNSAFENKIINGISNNEFGVGLNIKRQDMAKIINTVLLSKGIKTEPKEVDFIDSAQIAYYAKEHVMSIYSLGIISGDDNKRFNPENFATRAEAAKMIYGMLVQIVNS